MSIILPVRDNFYAIFLQALTKKKQNARRVYQDSWHPNPTPQLRKLTADLNLTCKNIESKTKNK